MSRVERWKEHREEIAQSYSAINKLDEEISQLNSYKKQIDKINPGILKNIKIEHIVPTFVSINHKNNSHQENIIKTIDIINEEELKKLNEQIININNVVQESIIDGNGNVSKEWLENQEGYKICKDLNKKIVVLQENLNEFAVITQKKLEKLEKSETTDFKKNYVEKITELDDKTAVIKNSINKKIYFILLGLLAVSAVTLVIVVALI
ncbi:MAG: hypothetical protein LBV22_02460 [Mycoplasmataceae bacterium]|nr:hypothetical protein [Mycoplasmataceae bacterium]